MYVCMFRKYTGYSEMSKFNEIFDVHISRATYIPYKKTSIIRTRRYVILWWKILRMIVCHNQESLYCMQLITCRKWYVRYSVNHINRFVLIIYNYYSDWVCRTVQFCNLNWFIILYVLVAGHTEDKIKLTRFWLIIISNYNTTNLILNTRWRNIRFFIILKWFLLFIIQYILCL